MSDEFCQRVAAARAALEEQDDPSEALELLRPTFFQVGLSGGAERLLQALELLSPLLRRLVGPEAAAPVDGALAAPEDAQMLYDAGYRLTELDLPEAAACCLGHANELCPGQEPIVTELVAALERTGHNQLACQVLQGAADLAQTSFICRYLLAFNSVMSGDLQAAQALLPELQAPGGDHEAFMAARIDAMLRRAELTRNSCDLGPTDLRGWHFVTTGGLLLHRSPYDFEEGMNGRYAYVADTVALCKLGLLRLQALLEAWDESPPWILAPADRDSQILAAAAEEVLGLPVVEYTQDAGPGLVVVYDLSRLDSSTPAEILEHVEGQLLFAHATCWTTPPPCVPDITTLLYQGLQPPWGQRVSVDADGETQIIPEDTRPAPEIAAQIVASEPMNGEAEAFDPVEDVLTMARSVAKAAPFRCASGRRSPMWEGGPVKSGRPG